MTQPELKIDSNQFYAYQFTKGETIIEFKGFVDKSEEPTYVWQLVENGSVKIEIGFPSFLKWQNQNTEMRKYYEV